MSEIVTWTIDRVGTTILHDYATDNTVLYIEELDNSLIDVSYNITNDTSVYDTSVYDTSVYDTPENNNSTFYDNLHNEESREFFITGLNDSDIQTSSEYDDFIPFVLPITKMIKSFTIPEIKITCCICLDIKEHEQLCQLNCQHIYCQLCIEKYITNHTTCPLCREDITHIYIQK